MDTQENTDHHNRFYQMYLEYMKIFFRIKTMANYEIFTDSKILSIDVTDLTEMMVCVVIFFGIRVTNHI